MHHNCNKLMHSGVHDNVPKVTQNSQPLLSQSNGYDPEGRAQAGT